MVQGTSWSDPGELAERVLASPASPIRRGVRFVVAEVVRGQGIRLHDVWYRTDERVSVGGVEVVDRATLDRAVEDARAAEQRRQAALALARAERETLSRRNPVWTTD